MSHITKTDRVRDAFLDALRLQGASVKTMADLTAESNPQKDAEPAAA
jgi:hypothetical protein